ncbi:TPA: lytic transglycosylase domain-containing protein [Escherichia coli]|uniref:lytic transglycosylase domain-containing protein n=1 Tax=Escherichia coli TaxID=562 RepID=UPI0006A19340|nr:lytic transglycosylase domain-containing protein [Escherichia coli]EFH2872192.1 transglycosylase SLT domain-containing protein [Escherichia coli]EFH7367313.1 transglycosylase SLT domain-containing protein [Escherichia coli]EGI7150969.1 lytic transglycosylase domain-containing protein [Escherichia coli]EHW7469794.1 lytic transglycosylase domain-containing protein [Escherichia coli]EHX8040565.1 lytic transglycosylase domain-containing protein [Escherichia coli]
MSNSFDFELVASDQVSDAITRIDEAIRDLEPKLNKTKEGLQLGGQETVDGLNGFISRLENMSKSARDNVQFIGDMVPPLKMVGEISGKLGALGAVGAAGYGLQQVAYGFREASREAYNLDTASKNAGMRVDDFTRLAGAMRILGADSESANASIEGMAKTLKEAASGANGQVLGALSQIGVQIQKNKDGSVDTLKTMEEIARVFPTLRPEQQKSVADAMGFTPEMLALMREGERMKTLLAKSDTFGLTVDPELNKQLSDINGTMNELGASWDGLKQRSQNKLFKGLLSDGSVKDGLEGVTDLFTNGDFTGLSHALGFISSADAAKLRRIQGDKELYNSLPRSERGMVDAGFMTDAVSKRYDANYRATDTANQLQDDMAAITRPAVGGNNYVPYNQGGQYDDLLNEAGKQYGVDPRLLKAIMTQESNGNPYAVSSADARGLMQIMPSNFRSTGITDWTDPRQNIMAGAQILSENLKRSGGNVPLALRYYNGGYDTSRWGQQNQAYPGAVLGHYQRIINNEGQQESNFTEQSIYHSSGTDNGPGTSIITGSPSGVGNAMADNLARSLKEAMSDQKLKLEITLVNDKGEKKTYNVEDNGRIATAMNY